MTAWIESYSTKHGPRYMVGWRENGRIHRKKAGPYKKTAIQLKDTLENSSVTGIPIYGKSIKECVRDYLTLCHKTKKPRTTEIARTSLREFVKTFGDVHPQEITPSKLENLKNELLNTRNSNGANIVIRNIKTFFKYLMATGVIHQNPSLTLKQFPVQKVARFLNRKELAQLYKASFKPLRRAIYSMVYSGMRVGEFLALREKDITPYGVTVHNTKTGKPRNVPIPRKAMGILRSVLGRWTKNSFDRVFRNAVKRAGIGRIRAHDLRHTFASAYLKSGGTGTLADLREILGHSSLNMLQIYAHFQPSYLKERMSKVRL